MNPLRARTTWLATGVNFMQRFATLITRILKMLWKLVTTIYTTEEEWEPIVCYVVYILAHKRSNFLRIVFPLHSTRDKCEAHLWYSYHAEQKKNCISYETFKRSQDDET